MAWSDPDEPTGDEVEIPLPRPTDTDPACFSYRRNSSFRWLLSPVETVN